MRNAKNAKNDEPNPKSLNNNTPVISKSKQLIIRAVFE
jgi:hypothetical protein